MVKILFVMKPIPKIKNKVSKEINLMIEKELDRILHNFHWEKVEMTLWEKTNKITASEFLQL